MVVQQLVVGLWSSGSQDGNMATAAAFFGGGTMQNTAHVLRVKWMVKNPRWLNYSRALHSQGVPHNSSWFWTCNAPLITIITRDVCMLATTLWATVAIFVILHALRKQVAHIGKYHWSTDTHLTFSENIRAQTAFSNVNYHGCHFSVFNTSACVAYDRTASGLSSGTATFSACVSVLCDTIHLRQQPSLHTFEQLHLFFFLKHKDG